MEIPKLGIVVFDFFSQFTRVIQGCLSRGYGQEARAPGDLDSPESLNDGLVGEGVTKTNSGHSISFGESVTHHHVRVLPDQVVL